VLARRFALFAIVLHRLTGPSFPDALGVDRSRRPVCYLAVAPDDRATAGWLTNHVGARPLRSQRLRARI